MEYDFLNKFKSLNEETIQYLQEKMNTEICYRALDALEDGIIFVDSEGRILYLNQAYGDILHVETERIIGKYIQKIEPDSRLAAVLRTHKQESREFWKIPSIGKYVSMRIYPLFEGGRFEGAFSIFKDVTVIRNLNKEINRISELADDYLDQIQSLQELKNMGVRIGSRVMLKLFSQAETIARTDVPVLITGESGSGKEVFANYIYRCSKRRENPIITVNCAAIPLELMESELFGYEEGAFTGALKGGKKGKFELANGGTIFLDEIGELPLMMQSKLLRVLQEGEIEKIGRQKRVPVNVRVIAATNQNLEQLIEEKKFRKDLFFRLNTITINVPPLRERKEDIPLLAKHFLDEFNSKYGNSVHLSEQQLSAMEQYDWPGNIRELRNFMERTVILNGEDITVPSARSENASEPAALPLNSFSVFGGTLSEQVSRFEQQVIRKTLEANGYNRTKTMEQLGISRRTFYRKCKDINNDQD